MLIKLTEIKNEEKILKATGEKQEITDKGTAVRFFVEKIASQWNNPTFQSLWYYNVREAMIERSPWVESVINGTGARVLCTIANYLQSFFLFGNLSYLVYRWKKIKLDELLLVKQAEIPFESE